MHFPMPNMLAVLQRLTDNDASWKTHLAKHFSSAPMDLTKLFIEHHALILACSDTRQNLQATLPVTNLRLVRVTPTVPGHYR